MKNILVTGGAGYIGSIIVQKLIISGYNVIVIDNLSTGHKKLVHNKCHFFKSDFADLRSLDKIFTKFKIDSVIHLAASLSVEESMLNPKKYYLNNVFKTVKILKYLKNKNIKKFIFSSTCSVYGNPKIGEVKVKEKSFLDPESHYGLTKMMCEQLIKNYSQKSSFKYIILRYFNVVGAEHNMKFGPVNNSGQLFKVLANNIINKKLKINIYGKDYDTHDGSCIRDYIDVNDLAAIHLNIIKAKIKKSFTVNCGYGYGLSVLEIVKEFEKIIKNKIKLNITNRRKGDVEKIFCDDKLLKKTGFLKHKTPLIKTIRSQINWEKKINTNKL
jgi:UDP-glucose 4-epimerase